MMKTTKKTTLQPFIPLLTVSLKKAWEDMKHNPKHTGYAILSDLVFFVLFGFITAAYITKVGEYIQAIAAVGLSAQATTSQSLLGLVINDYTAGYITTSFILSIAAFATLYILTSYFIGISTYISTTLSSFKLKKLDSILSKQFILLAPWFGILAFRELIAFYFSYIATVQTTLGLGTHWYMYVDMLLLAIIGYFMSITLLTQKSFIQTITFGVKSWKPLGAVYSLVLLSLGLLSIISGFLMSVNIYLAATYQVAIVLGFFVYVRATAYHFITEMK